MLDSGCSTYILSTDFANAGNIPYFPCEPVPVELAVQNTDQFTLDTQTKTLPMELGNITQSKASYILPLPNYNAIFSMPFLNNRKLAVYPEKNLVVFDDIEFPLVKDIDDEYKVHLKTQPDLNQRQFQWMKRMTNIDYLEYLNNGVESRRRSV